MSIAKRYERYRDSHFSYSEVGATRLEDFPSGYKTISRRVHLGNGIDKFHVSCQDLSHWVVQTRAGVQVYPESVPCETGATVLLRWGFGPFRVSVPCRIVWIVSESRRAGFAYGTIAGHPESGEESFVLECDQSDDVWFTIRAFSLPARWYSRLAAPLADRIQDKITKRYLDSLTDPYR
jgi:uncharacterized protein (UPF0548 family)